jgi:integrase
LTNRWITKASDVAGNGNDARQKGKRRKKSGPAPTGSVDQRKGRWRARVQIEGRRVSLGLFASESDARSAVAAHRKDFATNRGPTLAEFGVGHLDRRELHGKRGVKDERCMWQLFVCEDPLGQRELSRLISIDAEEWLDRMLRRRIQYAHAHSRNGSQLSRSRIKNALTMINGCLDAAVRMQLAPSNPFRSLRVPARAKGNDVTGDKWHVLDLEGQRRIEGVALSHRYMQVLILFALWTGLRQSEQWNLERADVHLDEQHPWMRIRFGSQSGPVKEQRGDQRARDVFLLPRAAELLRAWLREMPTQMRKSSSRLVFPNHLGERRSKGEPSWWQVAKARAKIPKFFRWHDLRHTCASSLLAGWWGRAWRLEEVKEYLGHSDIKVTQRYARLGASVMKDAVSGTAGRPLRATENEEGE